MEYVITITEKKLTDGSRAYDVTIGDVEIHAISDIAADTLVAKISEAIDLFSVDSVTHRYIARRSFTACVAGKAGRCWKQ